MMRYVMDHLVYALVKLLMMCILFFRFDRLAVLADIIAKCIFLLPIKKRRQMLKNLAKALPNSLPEQLNRFAFLSVKEMVLAALEIIYWYRLYLRNIEVFKRDFFSWVKWENYKFSVEKFKDKPALLVTAHFSNFVVCLIYLALNGRRVGVFLKKLRNRRLQELANTIITSIGIIPLYIDEPQSLKKAASLLQEKAIIVTLLDQHFGRKGRVKVDFFGRAAYAAKGAITLAQKYKAVIFPVLVWREGKILVVKNYPILWQPGQAKTDQDVLQEFTSLLEKEIIRKPYLWAWMHNRWKV